MTPSVINITFSAATNDGAKAFIDLMVENVTHQSFWYQITEKHMQCADGSTNSYWMGQLSLTVKSSDLNNCLVQADSVKDGYIPNADHIFAVIFRDVRVEVATEIIDSIEPLKEQNKYLHNKAQEMARAIEMLEGSNLRLTKLCTNFQAQIETMTARWNEQQAFLHDFIDFKNLIKVVRETAQRVDEEILDTYPLQRVH